MKQFNSILCLVFLVCTLSVNAQLSGSFTVGDSTADYTDLNSAATALTAQGIATGGVTLTIVPGTYDERVIFENIAGLSSTAPLIITATPGTVTFASTGTSGTSDSTLRFNSLSWVTVENLIFTDAGTPANEIEHAIRFVGSTTVGCSNNTLSNLDITMGANGARPGTRTRGILFNSSAPAGSAALANNDNLIDNVLIDNAAWGIQMTASADFFGRLRQVDSNNTISNCTFGSRLSLGHDGSSSAIAINALGSSNFTITNNVIASISNLNSTATIPVSTTAISLDSCSGEVSNNIIQSLVYEGNVGSVFGIRSSTIAGESTLIINNSISGLTRAGLNGTPFIASTTDNSLNLTGIWIFSQSGNNGLAQVLHNSVYLDAPAPVSFDSGGINLVGGSSGAFPATVSSNIIVNNISTTSTSYEAFALVDGNTARGFLTSDNNLLFANGTNGYLGGIGRELGGSDTFTNDLSTFITISQTNTNSFSFLPELIDPANSDLGIPTTVSNPNDYRIPISALVPNDITGTTRNTPLTFVGAYESSQALSIASLNKSPLILFPNPASEFIQLGNTEINFNNSSLKIYSMSGILVHDQVVTDLDVRSSGIDITALASGTYIVQVTNDQTVLNTKLVVK